MEVKRRRSREAKNSHADLTSGRKERHIPVFKSHRLAVGGGGEAVME